MWFKNALIFDSIEGYRPGAFEVLSDRFVNVFCEPRDEEAVDLQGMKVIPGLIDIHTHGAMGADFSDGDEEGLIRIAEYMATRGITGFLPTSMSLPYERLSSAFDTAFSLRRKEREGLARIYGIHMEGPFFSMKKKGAQNAEYLKEPDIDAFMKLYSSCGRLIRIADVAPELEGALAFAGIVKDVCAVSVAHTDATYEEAAAVYDAGASHLTHLFNAMPGIHHRAPGVIAAASERSYVTAELICDGLHVHPAAIRLAYKLFDGRICLISDSLRCLGMPDGEYELSGQKVILKGKEARLEDGTIAGSSTDLYDCMLNAISYGIPEDDAIISATIMPAFAAGIADIAGSIEDGKYADFVVCDNDLNRKAVYIGGNKITP